MDRVLLTKQLGTGPQTFDEYRAEGGYEALTKAVTTGPLSVLEAVQASGLRGRGGAGFPVGLKWSLAASQVEATRYVVANGGEDEPGSRKDRILMEDYPHRILEGLLLASYAIGAEEAFVYVNSTYEHAASQIERAIGEATEAGMLGENVAGSGHPLQVRIQAAPQQYVASEDSAAIRVIEGREPLPRQKPPFPTTAGLHGKPTVVNNVETFANIPAILLRGADWFRRQGTEDNPGTMLFTLPANLRRPGVVEAPIGLSLRELIEEHGGGLASGNAVKAVMPGGPSSGLVTATDLEVRMDRQPLTALSSALGCGALRVIEESECVVEILDSIAQFFQEESCGQCPTCQMETNALARITSSIRTGRGSQAMLDQIPKLAAFSQGKGFCGLISMPFPPLMTAVRLFPEDWAYHIEHGACPSPR
ncbi:MAG: SLBB domain-containing protein [Chloroflexi bacterium]|nr:SLBB domain-containing protein [Chloroflexota bacterium]